MKRQSSALLFCLLLVAPATLVTAKEEIAPASGPAMAKAAQAFVAALSEAETAKATMKFDDPARLDWHNIPKPTRKGLQLHDMSDKQQELALALVRSALSDEGYLKATRILSLENNLREGEKGLTGTPLRDPERYFLTIFGTPDTKGEWGWSFEGHHFSLNFVVRDGIVVADTPSFWGANPATVKTFIEGGPKVGVRTLADEEQLAFDLVNSLDETQLKTALIAAKAPEDYRAAGQPIPPQEAPVGLIAAKMTDTQKATLNKLLQTYTNHLAPDIAAKNRERIASEGLDRVHFAWAGSTQPGVGHYYRVQGPSFVLELVNIQSDPAGNAANHIHSVWRNIGGDFAVPVKKPQ